MQKYNEFNKAEWTLYLWILTIVKDPHSLLLNLSDKINLKRNVALSNLTIYYTWKT